MPTSLADTLEQALGLLGYRDDLPSHYRSNLLHAIGQYAALSGNGDLEQAVEVRLNRIRDENQAARSESRGVNITVPRQIKTRAEIDAWMAHELSKHQGFGGCTFTVTYGLQSPDSDGCNWTADCHLVAGKSTDARQAAPIANSVIGQARSLFNLPV